MSNPFLSIKNPKPFGAGSYEMAFPLINALNLKPGMRVLEIGAGSGQVATILAKNWNVSVVTLEPWEDLKAIQDFSIEQGVENLVLAMNVNAKQMPFPDNSFDVVFAIGSFFMIDEREKALSEIIRVTRKNGYIGIAEPMSHSIEMPTKLYKHEIASHYQNWLRTLAWNTNLFKQYQLTVFESYYFSESFQWMKDNFRYYDGEKDFILDDNGRWLSLGLVVGQKLY